MKCEVGCIKFVTSFPLLDLVAVVELVVSEIDSWYSPIVLMGVSSSSFIFVDVHVDQAK